jgi:hypothetical protein
MTAPWVGFGMGSMTLPLHTEQWVGRRGGPKAAPMYRSVGEVEAARKFTRQNAAVQTALPLANETGVGADGQHVPLGFDTAP